MARKTGIYGYKNGEKVELSASKVKKAIMEANKWSAKTYKKKYDIFKNKLRAFEAFEKSRGKKVEKQSAVKLLYLQAQAKKREGKAYKPSIKMKRIQSFTSISSGKAGQKALQSKVYQARRAETYETGLSKQFKGLIENNTKAEEIAEAIKDPVKREEALSAYANALHLKIKADEEVAKESAIPIGEGLGSDASVDFDYSEYL